MNDSTEDRQDVIVFWDFETSPSLSSVAAISTYEMVKNIRSAVAMYGPLKSIRLYWDFSSHPFPSTTLRIRSEFSASGVSLIDCPAEGRKGAAIKKMLVDMLFHAWGSSLPPTFVVITGDRDVAYALAMLRNKSYRVVLISPAGSHPDLTSQASVQLDWSRTILGINGESNEDGLFPNEDCIPSSTHAPARSSNSFKPGQETFTFRSEFPSATLRDTPAPALKPSIFSSPYSKGLNIFGGPCFPSPKFPLGLGDPLVPLPNQKPPRSRSGSLNELSRSTPLTNKGKNKASEPEDIELHRHPPPPSSRSRLWSSASIFGPFDDDDELPIPRSPPPAPVGPERAVSSNSSGSRRSKFSFEEIHKPTEVTTAEPVDQQTRVPLNGKPARLSNEPQAATVTASPGIPQKKSKSKTPTPKQTPKATKPKKEARAAPANPMSHAWMPLIQTLRKNSRVLSKSTIAPTLLKNYPDAFQTAGVRNIKTYLEAAIKAGIISMDHPGKGPSIIYLRPPYFS